MKLKNGILKFKIQRVVFFLSALLVAIALIVGYSFLKSNPVSASWYDDNWAYRQIVAITNSTTAQTDYQIQITLNTSTLISSKMQSDCDDLRITDVNGKLLPFWIEPTTCNTTTTKIWVKVPSIPSTGGSVYLYYGNPSANSGQVPSTVPGVFIREITTIKGSWLMNESAANTCTGGVNDTCDSSGNGYDGAWNGNSANTTGKFNNGISFDGTDDYVSLPVFSSQSTGSISLWFNPDANFGANSEQVINQRSGTARAGMFQLSGTTGNKLNLLVHNGSSWSTNLTTNSSINTQQWNNVVVTWDSSGKKIYINGTLDNNSSSDTQAMFNGVENIWLGLLYDNNWDFNGTMDELRIYTQALTQAEITDIYNNLGYTTTNYAGKELIRKFYSNVSVGSPSSEEKAPSPVAYWGFDEGTGTTAQDSSTNNNDGTLSGTTVPTWQTEDQCIAGKCLSFNGSTAYVDMGTSSILNPTSNTLTLGAWVKTNSTTAGAPLRIITRDANTTNGEPYVIYSLSLNSVNAGSVYLEITTGGTRTAFGTAANAISANQWYYVAATYDGTTAKIYINGNLNTSQSVSGNMTASSGKVFVGIRDASSPKQFFNGYIDEVKIYPYARTAAQVLSDYNSRGSVKGAGANLGTSPTGPPVLNDSLVGYWKMNETSANTCSGGVNDSCDSSSNGNNGAWNGDAATAAGKYNGGVTFDGTGDFITVADNATFDIASGGSVYIAAWIKTSSATNQEIFSNYACTQHHYSLRVDSTGTVTFGDRGTSDTSNGITGNATSLTNGNWHHVVAGRDGSASKLRIYIDGILDKEAATTHTDAISPTVDGQIGKVVNCGPTDASLFVGTIDEVRIYNRALPANDVATLYAQGPQAELKMEEGSGTSANDSSTNARTGTLNGGSTWTSGKYGKGVKVDGASGSNVSVPDFSY